MNTQNLTIEEQEAQAYAAGDTATAALLGRIIELEAENKRLEQELENAQGDSLSDWESKNGPAYDYVQFFQGCFDRLAGHYPCPSITSDYDKSVIFSAIEKSEGATD
ncbi:MAG: hypothetical protein AN484_11895 [Aphanizomenon flos-aquae WA102]|uniref:Uncharacterized protein n=1 Tax=Aphanizomenon flos-aquae WA102 TaxID=1710896 RepID=A0A1B7X2B5_APHFL|nr:MAG: hypothetical protein AN484_11895 [Aphanizomenon flos-aquae WA102]